MLNITVCGGGTVTHSIAAVSASRGFAVTVYTRQPERWSATICAECPNGDLLAGTLGAATSDPRAAVRNADVVLVCVPHCARYETLQRLAPHLRPNTLVGAVPGFGGFGYAARALL